MHLQNPICRILPHLICFKLDGCLGLCKRIDSHLVELASEMLTSANEFNPVKIDEINGPDLSYKQYVGNAIRDAGMNFDSKTQGDFYEYIGEAAIKAVREY